jgi:hypothetical protein
LLATFHDSSEAQKTMVPCQTSKLKGVRFGYGVRFGSKADMCSAQAHVRFVPKADIPAYSMTSSARPIHDSGTVTPSALAVFQLDFRCLLDR